MAYASKRRTSRWPVDVVAERTTRQPSGDRLGDGATHGYKGIDKMAFRTRACTRRLDTLFGP